MYVVPSKRDILAGRSGEAFTHEGNVQLRQTCARLLNKYIKAPIRTQKSQIIRDVIKSIANEGGRFLKQEPKSKQWYDAGFKEAKMRISRTFRDAAVPNKVKCIEKMSTTGTEGPVKPLCVTSTVVLPFPDQSTLGAPGHHIPTSFINLPARSDTPPLVEDDEMLSSFEEQGSNNYTPPFVTKKRASVSMERRDSITSLLGDGLLVNVFEDVEVSNVLTRMPREDFSSGNEYCHNEGIEPPTCLSSQALEEMLHGDIGALHVPQHAY